MLDMKAVIWIILFCFSILPCQAGTQTRLDSIEERLARLEKERPYLSVCAYRESHRGYYQAIPYDSVFHSSTNIEEGGMDICTGKFLSGLSGTYSVSWNYFSGSRGPGRNVVLRKNNREVTETQGTWTLQGRTVLIDMEEGDTLELNYNDNNNYGVERVTFCISLVHDHAIKTVASYTPDMRVIPAIDSKTYHLQLSGNNDYLADKVEQQFQNNKKINSTACGQNTLRSCERKCNPYTRRECDLGCSFDYNSLGDCRDRPYGYSTIAGEDKTVNPCFFLYFEPVEYWNPDHKAPQTRNLEGYPVPESQDELQFTCSAKVSEKIDLYSLLLEMDDKDIGPMDIQLFIDDKELFNEMAILDEEIEDLFQAQRILDEYYREYVEFSKVIELLNTTKDLIEDSRLKEMIEELLDVQDEISYLKITSVLKFRKVLVELNPVDQKIIKEKLVILASSFDLDVNDLDSLHESLDEALCPKHPCSLMGEMYNMHNGVIRSYNITENLKNFHKFLDVLKLIEIINEKNMIKATYTEILLAYKFEASNWPILKKFSENKTIREHLDKYSNDILFEFQNLQGVLNRKKEEKENINLSFYPRRQTIPKKYFPLTGDEESPYVALKLHLQDKPGLVPGQEILVKCKAWYKDVVHQDEPGSGMVEFKIMLE